MIPSLSIPAHKVSYQQSDNPPYIPSLKTHPFFLRLSSAAVIPFRVTSANDAANISLTLKRSEYDIFYTPSRRPAAREELYDGQMTQP